MPYSDLKSEFIEDLPTVDPTADLLDNEDSEKFGDINADFLEEKKRPAKAIRYEDQAKSLAQLVFAVTVRRESTISDAAALVMYGPDICEKLGDLAAVDKRVAKGLDFLTGDVISNPYVMFATACLPLAMQVARNHEPQLEVKQRGIKIPFTKKRFGFKFGVKLGLLRMRTKEPEAMRSYVFDDPKVIERLKKLGINVDTDTD